MGQYVLPHLSESESESCSVVGCCKGFDSESESGEDELLERCGKTYCPNEDYIKNKFIDSLIAYFSHNDDVGQEESGLDDEDWKIYQHKLYLISLYKFGGYINHVTQTYPVDNHAQICEKVQAFVVDKVQDEVCVLIEGLKHNNYDDVVGEFTMEVYEEVIDFICKLVAVNEVC